MKRKLMWTDDAWEEYKYWQQQDKKTLKRINKLIEDITRNDPYSGVGKPEPLKYTLRGCWSRRIDDANRLVYSVQDSYTELISCRYHYKK